MSRTQSFGNKNINLNNLDKDFSIWEWEDVSNWLINNNMQNYVENFKKYEINGYDLCYLTNEDFNEIKLTNFHDRNLVLKKIRLMTLEQRNFLIKFLVKIQIIHEDKNFTIQLEFDPNFTVENLIHSMIDLLRLQNTMIYLTTLENEILISNLKIVDLIFLNPAKYKKLKVLTASSTFLIPQPNNKDEKNFTSKRYDVVMQSTSDYLEDKSKLEYGFYKFNDEVNLKSNNMIEYNPSNEKIMEPSNKINNNDFKYRSDPTGFPKDKDKESIQHKINYLKSKNNSTFEDEYLKERQAYEDYAYNNKSSIDLNKENITINTGTNSNPNIINASDLKNTSNYDYKNYYDKDSTFSKGTTHLNTTMKKYDYAGNSDELDNKLNANYNTKYKNYGGSNNEPNRDINKDINSNKNVNVNERSRSRIERDPSLNNINAYNDNFEKKSSIKDIITANNKSNEENNRLESLSANQNSDYSTNKYNYSDRLVDDLNRQRYSSEKRNFRNNQSGKQFISYKQIATATKKEEKSSELDNTSENKGKYEKYNDNYVDKMKYKYINDGWDALKYEKDSVKSQKDQFNPSNVNIMDIKSKINSIRSQVSSNMSFDRKVSEKNLESFSNKQALERDNVRNKNFM